MIDALGTQPANPAAVVTGLTAHAAFWDGVDGLLSYRGDGSRILTNVATIKKLAELQIGTNGPLLVDRYGDGGIAGQRSDASRNQCLSQLRAFQAAGNGLRRQPDLERHSVYPRRVHQRAGRSTCDNGPHAGQLQAGTHGRPRPG